MSTIVCCYHKCKIVKIHYWTRVVFIYLCDSVCLDIYFTFFPPFEAKDENVFREELICYFHLVRFGLMEEWEDKKCMKEEFLFFCFVCLFGMMKMINDKKRGGWSFTSTPTKIHPHQLGEKMFVIWNLLFY